jgi:hypothetical protein
MTVVVTVPGYDPWKVANWAFRVLADRAQPLLAAPDDRNALVQAQALNGLHFDMLNREQQARLAAGLMHAADDLRAERLTAADPRDREFADALGELALRLSDLVAAQ